MGIRRRPKRYGPVHKRGVRTHSWDKTAGKPKPEVPTNYTVLAGTNCNVRKCGETVWKSYCTKSVVSCKRYVSRDRTHYVFAFKGYEIEVRLVDAWVT